MTSASSRDGRLAIRPGDTWLWGEWDARRRGAADQQPYWCFRLPTAAPAPATSVVADGCLAAAKRQGTALGTQAISERDLSLLPVGPAPVNRPAALRGCSHPWLYCWPRIRSSSPKLAGGGVGTSVSRRESQPRVRVGSSVDGERFLGRGLDWVKRHTSVAPRGFSTASHPFGG